MVKEMKNRVLGTSLVRAEMSSVNNSFEGLPRQTTDGKFYASSVSFKWAVRNYWKHLPQDEKRVLITKYLKDDGKPMQLEHTYEMLFQHKPSSVELTEVIDNLLMNTYDVPNFGVTFANKSRNFSMTGPVQVGYGLNLLPEEYTELIYDDILSPFTTGEDKNQSTIGKIALLSDALFGFDFVVNPKTIVNSFNDSLKYRYTEEDYLNFKRGAMKGATVNDSLSKKGNHNVMGIFITLKEDSLLSIGNVNNYLVADKLEDGSLSVDITKLVKRLEGLEQHIEKLEIFIDEFEVTLIGNEDDTFDVYNIDFV